MNPYLDITIRVGTVYLLFIFALRLFGVKELAQLSVIYVVFILLISNAVQNSMVGSDASLAGGIVAATTLFIINFILKKLTLKSNTISKIIQGGADYIGIEWRSFKREPNEIRHLLARTRNCDQEAWGSEYRNRRFSYTRNRW